MCNRLSEVHHLVVPLSLSDDENDGNSDELMDIKGRTGSSPDLSETREVKSRPELQKQSKTRSSHKSLDLSDKRHERPNEKGMQTNGLCNGLTTLINSFANALQIHQNITLV